MEADDTYRLIELELAPPGADDESSETENATRIELFRSREGEVFADIYDGGIRQTWPVRSKTFSWGLARRYFETTNKVAVPGRLKTAINQIEAEVQAKYPEREVFRRVGKCDGRVYLDLTNEKWEAVEIDASGWRVVQRLPIRFVRTSSMLALPVPEMGGSVEALRSLVNLDDDSFTLVVAWLLGALHSDIAKPVLAIRGGEGAAKSTLVEIVRGLIDPYDPPYTGVPVSELKLSSAAAKSYCQAFDNVSGLKRTMSDAICRFVTDGSDQPVILNGISDVVTSADLADRCIFIDCAPIPDTDRRTYSDVMGAFAKVRPAILGALLDAVAGSLRNPTQNGPDGLPRMADFAQTAARCEAAFWPAGTFMAAYKANRTEIVEALIEANPWHRRCGRSRRNAFAGRARRRSWDAVLRAITGNLEGTKGWPSSAQILAKTLRELAPALLKVGIDVKFHWSHDRHHRRLITITAGTHDAASKEEPVSASAPESSGSGDAQGHSAGADGPIIATPTVSPYPPVDNGRAAVADAADAENAVGGDNRATSAPNTASLSAKHSPAATKMKGAELVGSREAAGKSVPVYRKLRRGKPTKPTLSWQQIIQQRQHSE